MRLYGDTLATPSNDIERRMEEPLSPTLGVPRAREMLETWEPLAFPIAVSAVSRVPSEKVARIAGGVEERVEERKAAQLVPICSERPGPGRRVLLGEDAIGLPTQDILEKRADDPVDILGAGVVHTTHRRTSWDIALQVG